MLKLTDIMCELLSPNVVYPDVSYHTYSFSVTLNNSGEFVPIPHGDPDEHTFTACPPGGWSDASISQCELGILMDANNEYFRAMCRDLLCRIEQSGLWIDVLDDSDTLPPGQWIAPNQKDGDDRWPS